MTSTESERLAPSEPESLEQTGLSHTLVQQLIVKILYFRGDLYGQDLCRAIGLKFSVIQDIVDNLILQHHVQIKRSLGVGHVAALMNLTESGRARAREYLDANQYAGPAPVPIAQKAEGWLTKEALQKAFSGMVITEGAISQIGPAVCSANSLLIYGKPGDGKTYLVESLNNLESSPIFVPHAIEFQGNIVQVFDPIYHQPLEEDEPSVLAIAVERSHDRRWIRCRPPFIVSGGELSLDSLDLSFNRASKIYEAPFQLKANNGLYLIDDFGRQRATPAEVLNRWIVPMERRVDYLSFLTGGKITVPFETFLVFSTNLSPSGLGDEAFLRRIQYKMLLRGPAENEFIRIFEDFCAKRRVSCPVGLAERLIEKRYRRTGKPLRRCHPRDLLSHALNLIQFEKLPYELNDEILDRAFASCFIEEEEELAQPAATSAQPAATPAQPPATPSPATASVTRPTCAGSWDARLAQSPSMFGALYQLSSLRAKSGEGYEDAASAREFGAEETSSVLARLHRVLFNEWLNLRLSEQMSDLRKFAEASNQWAQIRNRWRELAPSIAPSGATAAEISLFIDDFSTLTDSLGIDPGLAAPAPLQKIA
jgi:hypothetical protein